ncbi:hypothetical protein V1478_018579, partial [Vespula squamosa]
KSLLKSTHVFSSIIAIVVVVVLVVAVAVAVVVVVVLIHTGVYANSRFSKRPLLTGHRRGHRRRRRRRRRRRHPPPLTPPPPSPSPSPSPSTLSPSHPLRDTPKGRLESVLATSLHARPNVVTMSDQTTKTTTTKKMQTEARLNSASFARLRRINVGGANQPIEFLFLYKEKKEEEEKEEEEEEGDRRKETIEKMMSVVPTLASCEQQPDYMDGPESLFGIIKAREKLGKIQQTIYLHDY